MFICTCSAVITGTYVCSCRQSLVINGYQTLRYQRTSCLEGKLRSVYVVFAIPLWTIRFLIPRRRNRLFSFQPRLFVTAYVVKCYNSAVLLSTFSSPARHQIDVRRKSFATSGCSAIILSSNLFLLLLLLLLFRFFVSLFHCFYRHFHVGYFVPVRVRIIAVVVNTTCTTTLALLFKRTETYYPYSLYSWSCDTFRFVVWGFMSYDIIV